MTRNLKTLGLALLAVFALSAIAAQAASAVGEPKFEAINNSTTAAFGEAVKATGFQEEENIDRFHTTLGELTCKNVHFDGTEEIVGQKTKAEVTPTFGKPAIETKYNTGDPTNCHANTPLGTKQVTVTHNECKFNFHPEDTTEAGVKNGKFIGSVEITGCNKEKPGIEIHIYNSAAKHEANEPLCTYRVHEQKITGIHTQNVSTEVGGVKQHFVTVSTPTVGEGQEKPGAVVTLTRISGSALTCGAEEQKARYTAFDTVDALDLATNTRGVTITD